MNMLNKCKANFYDVVKKLITGGFTNELVKIHLDLFEKIEVALEDEVITDLEKSLLESSFINFEMEAYNYLEKTYGSDKVKIENYGELLEENFNEIHDIIGF